MILLVFSIGWSILVALAYNYGKKRGMEVEIRKQLRESWAMGLKHGLERAEIITGLCIIEEHDKVIERIEQKKRK